VRPKWSAKISNLATTGESLAGRKEKQKESGTKSLREIGELFSGFDYAAVAQRIRRTKSTYNSIAARRLITAMLNV
jgi:hypothetical protein